MRNLFFRGRHLRKWHYDESRKDPSDINVYSSVCGVRLYHEFVHHEIRTDDSLPEQMCSKCYRYVTLTEMPKPVKQPVKLELKAIKGATESWRPDWMDKS